VRESVQAMYPTPFRRTAMAASCAVLPLELIAIGVSQAP